MSHDFRTTTVTYWLKHLPRQQEVVSLIPSHDRPSKSLKLVVVAFPLGAQEIALYIYDCPASVRIMEWLSVTG